MGYKGKNSAVARFGTRNYDPRPPCRRWFSVGLGYCQDGLEMLNSLRKGAGSWIAKIFLGLLVLSFGIWGVGDYVTGRSEVTVAKVGDKEISGTEYRLAFNRELRRLEQQFGQILDPDQVRAFGVDQTVVQQMVSRGLVDQASEDLGLAISDNVVRDFIVTNPAFRDQIGQFDRTRFETFLLQSGLSEPQFVETTKADLVRGQLVGSIGGGVQATPNLLLDKIYSFRLERRIADYLVLPDSRQAVAEPTEEDLAKYHQDNAPRYNTPEFREISYIEVTPSLLAEQIDVGEDDLRAAYDSRLDEFHQPAARDLTQMIFADEDSAQKAFERLQAGEDFNAVAKDLLDSEPEDLSLGRVTEADLPAELAATAFGLADGEASEPVKSDFGWHVLRAGNIEPERTESFEQVADRLKQDLALERAIDEAVELTNLLEDELAAGASLEEAASKTGLPLKKVPALDRQGRDAGGNPVPDLPGGPVFVQTAMAATPEQELELTTTRDDNFFVLRIDSISEPSLRPMGEIRDRVVADWRDEQQSEANRHALEKLEERIKNGESFDAIAGELDVPVIRSEPMMRAGNTGTETAIPPDLQAKLFELSIGDVASGANPADRSHVLLRLAEVRAASDAEAGEAEIKDRLNEELVNGIIGDILGQYQTALERQIGVSVDQDAIAAVFAAGHGY